MRSSDFDGRRGLGCCRKHLVPRRLRAGLVALAAGLIAVGVAGQVSGVAAQPAAARCKNPTAQPPTPGTGFSFLNHVAATSGCQAWAVGYYLKHALKRGLIDYWNGRAWKVQKSPELRELVGVAATSPVNAWAVNRKRILHWNGRAWKIQKSPTLSRSFLFGVAATSATNAWVIGDYYNGTAAQTLIEHWNGAVWKVQKSPSPGVLSAVAATSGTNAWATGYTPSGSTLIEHWNGTAWKVQKGASLIAQYTDFNGVAATSPTNAWVVGSYEYFGTHHLIEHWNGKHWKVLQRIRGVVRQLNGVAATSPVNAWAVGDLFASALNSSGPTRILHWNGQAWKVQNSPTKDGILFGVAATSPSNAWAVGSSKKGGIPRAFAVHWNGTAWGP